MSDTSTFLFVYGTLRPTFDNAFSQYLRQRAHYMGDGWFPGQLLDLGSYPGAVYDRTSSATVRGTVYDIRKNSETVLTYLDYYEGVGSEFESPTEYIRAIVPVRCKGTLIDCWVYLYNHPSEDKTLIESGDYSHYLNQSR
ncbi:gamma-glutamylcyclotransferase family protein [Spirosoma endbachense]|uniref:Gamma-glutamylcyclotransferase n=1 Tax=Spirosoma endbachense TaxID=2666025 RepID=A0A6P1VQA9_9BACT|nr:gamma-glutamylcyclotransferase family protein [Spirosoma endbachense]QHV95451.1 gamma-glutamylcyclotransferase [Spirosoma endbachense]